MKLFNRQKTTENVALPQEVRDYYQAENRERKWVAVVVAALALLVTLFIALGIYYGGRWVYRRVRGTDKKPVITQTAAPESSATSSATTSTPSDTSKKNNPSTTSSPTSSSAGPTVPPSNLTPPPATTPAGGNATTGSGLPRTGPTSDD